MDVQHVSVGEMLKQSIAQAAAAKESQNGAEATPAPTQAVESDGGTEPAAPEGSAETAGEPESGSGEGSEAHVGGEEDVPAATPEVKKPSPPADIDTRLAKLSQASQKLIAERQKFSEERKQHEKELLEARQWREIVQNAKEDPVSLAELAGLAPDTYATLLFEKGSLTPERKRVIENEKKVRTLEERLQAKEAAEQQREASLQKQQILSQMTKQLRSGDESLEKYELVNHLNRYEDVLKVIEKSYHDSVAADPDNPSFMSFEEAAEIVEAQLDKELEHLVKLNKLRNKVGNLASGADTPAKASNSAASRKTPGTITSKVRAQSSPPKELSEAERMRLAGELLLAQMQGRRG